MGWKIRREIKFGMRHMIMGQTFISSAFFDTFHGLSLFRFICCHWGHFRTTCERRLAVDTLLHHRGHFRTTVFRFLVPRWRCRQLLGSNGSLNHDQPWSYAKWRKRGFFTGKSPRVFSSTPENACFYFTHWYGQAQRCRHLHLRTVQCAKPLSGCSCHQRSVFFARIILGGLKYLSR